MPEVLRSRGREPGVGVVLLALLLACLTVGLTTAFLLRPAPLDPAAVDRAAPEVRPTPPVDLADATGLHLYLVTHPDDELSGWGSLIDAPGLYPVVVLLTEGEATQRCEPTTYRSSQRADLGEIAPDPVPDGRHGPGCRGARIDSFRTALDGLAEVSPVVAGLAGAPTSVLEVEGRRARVQRGTHATLVLLDLGDGRLTEAAVEAAARGVLGLRGTELPDLPLGRVTASAYLAPEGSSSDAQGCRWPGLCPPGERPYIYPHADHAAARKAARALAGEAREGAWLVTHPYDPQASEVRALPRELYDTVLGLGDGSPATAQRLGIYQRAYGWLAFPDEWRRGDLPLAGDRVLFPRVQTYEVVEP